MYRRGTSVRFYIRARYKYVLVGDCMRRPHDTGPEEYMDERGHARRPLHVFGRTAVCSERAAHGTYVPVRKDAHSLEMNRGNTPRPLGVGGCTTVISTLVVSTRPRHITTQKNTYIVFYIDNCPPPFLNTFEGGVSTRPRR